MKISELIARLQQLEQEYGDVECFCVDTDDFGNSLGNAPLAVSPLRLSRSGDRSAITFEHGVKS